MIPSTIFTNNILVEVNPGMPYSIIEELLVSEQDRTAMLMFTRNLIVIQQGIQTLSEINHLFINKMCINYELTSEYQGQLDIVSIQPWPLKVIPFSSTNEGQLALTKLLMPSTSYE